MSIRYACAPSTDRVSISLNQNQLRIIHSALCDATSATRDRQIEWLNVHENPYVSADQAADAWQQFKQWEARETWAVESIGIIRATGVELDQQDFGLS